MDAATYILCKGYVKKTAAALGAVKGAPCTIKSITETTGGHTVTFEWVGDNDVKQTSTMFVADGADGAPGTAGASVASVTIDSSGHLITTLSDGTTIDAGAIIASTKTESAITANVTVGGVKNGKTYSAGTDIEDIITDMLVEYKIPEATFSTDPGTRVYDAVTGSIEEIELTVVATKTTNPITRIVFYVDNQVVHEITNGVADGGTFSYTYTPETPITTDVVFAVDVFDDQNHTAARAATIKFVGKTYYGIVDANVVEPTEAQIKELNSTLKTVKEYTYNYVSTPYGKVVYTYPKSFGTLTTITDLAYGINYENSFTLTEKQVDGIDYYVYTQTDPSAAEGMKLKFA